MIESKKYCCIIMVILLVLCSVFVSAGYYVAPKTKGLSGVNVNHAKPVIKCSNFVVGKTKVFCPTNLQLTKNQQTYLTSKSIVSKQASLRILGPQTTSQYQNQYQTWYDFLLKKGKHY